ncbi:MAG: glycosyltransferase family 39 protein [Myxococcota bacterium]|nr:glycosyltransferase family 39 protein [Myxococcota bacterium]
MARFATRIGGLARSRPRSCLAFVALLVRAPFLARASMSVDETRSVEMAQRLSSPELGDAFAFDLQAPLFPLLSVLQGAAAGADGRWLRLFPMLASVATVPVVYSLFRRWLGPREAFLGGLATAIAPFLVFYGKEARPYALAAFFFAAFLLVADRWQAGEGRRHAWLVLPGLALLASASHFAALPSLGCFFLIQGIAALRGKSGKGFGKWLAMGLVVGLGVSPIGIMLLVYAGDGGLNYLAWTSSIDLAALFAEQVFFLFGNSLGPGVGGIHLLLLGLGAPIVLAEARRRRELGTPLPSVVALWWVPIVLLWVVRVLTDRPLLYFPRAFLMGAPLLLLVFALGAATWWRVGGVRRVLAGLAIALFAGLGGLVATSSSLHPEYFGRSLGAEFRSGLAARLEPRDVVLVHREILTSYVAYEWPGPQKVLGLGVSPMTASVAERERAIRSQLARLPADRRLVLVLNGLANEGELDQMVQNWLDGQRPREAELPCWAEDAAPAGLLCERIFIYGPARDPSQPGRGAR